MNNPFFLHLPGFSIEEIYQNENVLVVVAHSQTRMASCPDCQVCSTRIHSRYQRTLTDLPWSGQRVRLCLQVHRFFCVQAHCPRRTFCEPITDLAPRFARRTKRLTKIFERLALALGGEAGARLATVLTLPCSPATLLRCLRKLTPPPVLAPRVIGIDDWAWRKGQRYGTLICDLEEHRPIELFRDRDVASLTAWLQQHPSLEIISRDRGGTYAEAARLGAPQAIQVADRWHLLQNLGEALELLLTRHLASHRKHTAQQVESRQQPSPEQVKPLDPFHSKKSDLRRQARLALYEQVVTLAKQGMRMRQIGCTVGLDTTTVEKWLAAGQFPERKTRPERLGATPDWLPYALKRWQEGKHSILAIYRELQAQGYQGSYWSVYIYLSSRRKMAQTLPSTLPVTSLSADEARWLFLQRPKDLTQEQHASLLFLYELDPKLELAYELIQQFTQMIRTHNAQPLQMWLQTVEASRFTELYSFVRGVRQDLAAVIAGLSLPWSQGQTEGQITRLKLIKRQMYGRAHFDLLRLRVLSA